MEKSFAGDCKELFGASDSESSESNEKLKYLKGNPCERVKSCNYFLCSECHVLNIIRLMISRKRLKILTRGSKSWSLKIKIYNDNYNFVILLKFDSYVKIIDNDLFILTTIKVEKGYNTFWVGFMKPCCLVALTHFWALQDRHGTKGAYTQTHHPSTGEPL